MARRRATIAGAGIAGLTSALALARSGFDSVVAEAAERLEEAGAGIQLSPNAMRILEDLGLVAALEPFLVRPRAIVVRSARTGRIVVRMGLSEARERWGADYAVIHRADLQGVLVKAVEASGAAEIRLATRVDRVDETAADLVLGADGLRSAVAASMGQHRPLRFSGRWAWRAVMPVDALPKAFKAPETGLWLGTGAHLVHYPVRGGAAVNLVAVTQADELPGGWSEPGRGQDIAESFRGWPDELAATMAGHEAWRGWPLYDRDGPLTMARGRVALAGDAAHPMLPFLAQGGAMAIEDAAVLAACLAGDAPLEPALTRYAGLRHARVARVQREARANAERYHWPMPKALVRDAGLALLGGHRLLARYDWLYGWRPPAA